MGDAATAEYLDARRHVREAASPPAAVGPFLRAEITQTVDDEVAAWLQVRVNRMSLIS